jgi:hypothetical protein
MYSNAAGWMFVWLGLIITGIGLAWLFIPWFGRLPGDIRIEGQSGGFYFPIVTCILLSIVASLILTVLRMLTR